MRRAALALSAALALAACGGGGPARLSRADYVRSGTAICQRYSKQIARLGQPTSIEQLGPFIARALPELSRAVAALGRLRAPQALDGQFARFLDAARRTEARARALRAAAARADGREVQRLLGEASRSSAERVALARAAALPACALS